MTASVGFFPCSSALNALSSGKLWVWIGDRSMPGPFEESDRSRPDAGRTDAAPNGQVLHLDLAEFGRDLLADVDSHHRDPALRARIVEDVRKRGGMARRLDDEVGAAVSQLPHRLVGSPADGSTVASAPSRFAMSRRKRHGIDDDHARAHADRRRRRNETDGPSA